MRNAIRMHYRAQTYNLRPTQVVQPNYMPHVSYHRPFPFQSAFNVLRVLNDITPGTLTRILLRVNTNALSKVRSLKYTRCIPK